MKTALDVTQSILNKAIILNQKGDVTLARIYNDLLDELLNEITLEFENKNK